MVVEVLALWSMNGFPASCGDNVISYTCAFRLTKRGS